MGSSGKTNWQPKMDAWLAYKPWKFRCSLQIPKNQRHQNWHFVPVLVPKLVQNWHFVPVLVHFAQNWHFVPVLVLKLAQNWHLVPVLVLGLAQNWH